MNISFKDKKMKTNLLISMAVAALILAGCGNDETDNWAGEIRLSSGIEVQTRATHSLDNALKQGETVHVWVDDANEPTTVNNTILYENNLMTVAANGALNGNTLMYFPESGNPVNIYALHTNAALAGDAFPGELTHKVAQNQQSSVNNAGSGYQGSDLLFAKSTKVARTSNAVKLKFEHLLSKIEVVLVQGDGTPSIEKAEIINTKLEALFTPSKTAEINVTPNGDAAENPIVIDNGLTSKDNAAQKDSDKGKVLNEAIIVPQTLAENTEFIRITTKYDVVLIYKLDKENNFEKGKKYRYTITANLTGLTVACDINPWIDGLEQDGNATMPEN